MDLKNHWRIREKEEKAINNKTKEATIMRRVYCRVKIDYDGKHKVHLVVGYQFNKDLFIHRAWQAEGWQVSHSCGLLCIPRPVPTFRRAKEIAKKLIELVPDWSDAETMSKTEKYFLARNYLRNL